MKGLYAWAGFKTRILPDLPAERRRTGLAPAPNRGILDVSSTQGGKRLRHP